jgi:hypothetical protein
LAVPQEQSSGRDLPAASFEILLGQFDTSPFVASRALRQLRDLDTGRFLESALRALASQPESTSIRFLATLVPLTDPILELIANPKAFEEDGARRIVEAMRRVDSQTESKLLRLVTANPAKPLAPQMIDRILDVIDAITEGPRLIPVLMQIFRSANPYLRARLALSIGRHHRNKDWIEDRMRDPDPRVRANAVEANWNQKDEQALSLFQIALRDSHHRVVGNGAVGLYYAGDIRCLRVFGELIASAEPNCRAAGLWAVGHVQDERFMTQIAALTPERDVMVRRAMVLAMERLKRAAEIRDEQPKLRLRLLKAARQSLPSGTGETPLRQQNHVFLEVKHPDATIGPIQGLKPLQFHLFEDDMAIFDYSVQERTRYIKPGTYDIYFTSAIAANEPDGEAPDAVGVPRLRIVVLMESASGVYEHEEAIEPAVPPAVPEEAATEEIPHSWDAFR